MTVQRRVLMVEDDPACSGAVARVLRLDGYDVQLAATASEALRLLEQGPFSIVLLDLVLKKGDGFEVLQVLKETKRPVPVIVATQHLRTYVAELASFYDQVQLIVNKPYAPADLAANVEALASP
jgi:DNA-binding response OmpR family regulator